MNTDIRFIPIILSVLLLVGSCTTVPRKEIAAAERAIQRADTVNAVKYATTEYTGAKDLLNSAKSLAGRDNNQARVDAIKSKRSADRAYFDALQEMMDGNIKDAQKANQEADEVKASLLSAEKYREAVQLLKEAEQEREAHRQEVERELTRDKKIGKGKK